MENTSSESVAISNISHGELLDYNGIHGYIATPLCFIGIITNLINFATWLRQDRITAVMFVLRILSLVDLLVAMSYLPVALYLFVMTTDLNFTCHSKSMMWFMLICNHVFLLSCIWSVWIALMVATIRCVNVSFSRQIFRDIPKLRRVSFFLAILFQMEGVPYYLFYKVEDVSENTGCVTYWIVQTELTMKSEIYHDFLFTLLALTRGVIPCVLFLILCFITIHLVIKRHRVQNQVAADNSDFQTTIMLFVIALLFFLCMVPVTVHPFILLGRSAANAQLFWFLDDNFVIFNANFLAVLQISHCSFGFIIYIVMSEKFRTSLKEILCCCRKPGYTPIKDEQDDADSGENIKGAQSVVKNTSLNLVY